ncbi:terminase [Enterobacter sp. CGMCC 5087]|uniref:terminase small subunit n=1 Tax=Enterobacter sp. CGMCC 5087 TaxID=2183878 RepID=UPI000D67277D|nr:terminase small subunit [Enterobacter sp. CGMCC 5087]PWI81973.1 terminase [Enterobacter sp. CGMCC 5087]
MSKPEDSGLERDYCAGVLSLRKLAEIYGLTEGAIRKRAIKNGWVRNKPEGTQKSTQVRKTGTQKKTVRTTEKKPAAEIKKNAEPEPEPRHEILFDPAEFGLNQQQGIFAEQVAMGKSRIDAYRQAGYSCEGDTAYAAASRLYRNVKVAKAVRYLRDKFQQRYSAEIDEIIHQLVSITRANPNDLSQYRRVNCRHCWGEHHLYQWRDIAEFDRAAAAAAKDGKKDPEYGGLGFCDTADPNPDCPKCFGEGSGHVFIPDTRDLEGDARWLYTGVKQTKFGIEVQAASQEAARRDLIKLLEIRASRKNGDPVVGDDPHEDADLTDEQLHEALEELGYGRRKNQLDEKLDDS